MRQSRIAKKIAHS